MRSVKAASALLGLLFVAGVVLMVDSARAAQTPPSPQPPARSDAKEKSDSKQRPNFWWRDDTIKKKIGLSADQAAQVENIFQSSVPNLRALREEFDRLEQHVELTIADPKVTETQLSSELDLVEMARSRAAKARTIMLWRMRRVLTPEQRVKLEEFHKFDRDNSQHRRETR